MKIEIDLETFAEQVKSGQSVTAKGGVLNELSKTTHRDDAPSRVRVPFGTRSYKKP